MTKRTAADHVVTALRSYGVRFVFGYPGGSILPLMDAIERETDIDWILVRHEGSAALAASALSKLTGGLGVCMATAGPGASNLLTGLLDAQLDRAPVLAITGMYPVWTQTRGGFQDIDQARMLGTVIGKSVTCNHPDQLPVLLRDCVGTATQERTVVHLAIPVDVQSVALDDNDPRFDVAHQYPEPLLLQPPPDPAVELVAGDIESLGDVVVVVGPRALGAGEVIERLAVKLGAAIISTLDAKGIIDESHPNSFGVLGIFGAPGVEITRDVLGEAEAILAFGVDDLAPFVVDQKGEQTRVLIQCEPDFTSVTHVFRRSRTLCGPIDDIAQRLLKLLPDRSESTTLGLARQAKLRFEQEFEKQATRATQFVHPVRVLKQLSEYLDEEAVVALDVGDNTVWAAQFLRPTARQRVLVSKQFGAMGFCLPALIASRLANPNVQLVGVTGDGGLQMVLGELLTAVQYGLSFPLIVLNNGRLQRIAAQQQRPVGTVLHNPDFVALAKACGADGMVVEAGSDLEYAFKTAFSYTKGPYILDVLCDPESLAPMGEWKHEFSPMQFS